MNKKANHTAPVIRIGEILPHPNADKLEITYVMDGAYQVVIGKGNFKTGDLAVYVQPDSVVPQTEPFKFIWGDHVGLDGTVPERRRRITVKKLRKEYSEGLLVPMGDFAEQLFTTNRTDGDDVSDLLGITHYDPDTTVSTQADTSNAPKTKLRYPKTLKGWFFFILHKLGLRSHPTDAMTVSFQSPTYDVENQKNYRKAFKAGEQVLVTEKIHGSNWRALCVDNEMYVGSHYQWKKRGDNAWWKALTPEIEAFCFQNQGAVVFGELTPTQGGYSYGQDAPTVFPFDVHRDTEAALSVYNWAGNEGLTNTVPIIYAGPYDESLIEGWSTGKSLVPGAKNIREGCVIRTVPERYERGLGRVQLKVVSKEFLEKENRS